MLQFLQRQRQPDRSRYALTERSGRDVHPGQHGSWVPLEPAVELGIAEQLLIVDRAHGLQPRVQQNRGVSFGQHEPVVTRIRWVVQIGPEVCRSQHGDQIGR